MPIYRLGRRVWFYAQSPIFISLAVAAVALAARLWGIGDKPLWYDEVLTLKRAGLPINELIADSFRNKHFPTYFIVLKPFVADNWSAALLRMPSAVFGAVSAFLVARIAGAIAGRKAAFAAGMLMALSPTEVQYGQEARAYALTSMAILLSLFGLVQLLQNACEAARVPGDDRPWTRPWIHYGLGTGLALITLNVALPWFVMANIIYFCLYWQRVPFAVENLRHWLVVNGTVAAIWLPCMALLVAANLDSPERGTGWIEAPTITYVLKSFQTLYTFRISNITTLDLLPSAVPGLGIAIALLAIFGTWTNRKGRVARLILAATLVMPCTLLLISLWFPLFVPRYLLWSTGPFFILAGAGIVTLPRSVQLIAICCIAGAAAVALLPYYSTETKPRWDLAANYLAVSARPNDQFITSSGLARVVLSAYLERLNTKDIDVVTARPLTQIKERIDAGDTLWLIHGRVGLGKLLPREQFLRSMAAYGQPIERQEFGMTIVVWKITASGQRN